MIKTHSALVSWSETGCFMKIGDDHARLNGEKEVTGLVEQGKAGLLVGWLVGWLLNVRATC